MEPQEWEGGREGTISTQLKERRRQQEPWGGGGGYALIMGVVEFWGWKIKLVMTMDDEKSLKSESQPQRQNWSFDQDMNPLIAVGAKMDFQTLEFHFNPPSTKKASPAQQTWPISMGRGATRGLCRCNFPFWQTASLLVAALTFPLCCWQFYCNEKYTNPHLCI